MDDLRTPRENKAYESDERSNREPCSEHLRKSVHAINLQESPSSHTDCKPLDMGRLTREARQLAGGEWSTLTETLALASHAARADALALLIDGSISADRIIGAFVSACWEGGRSDASTRRQQGKLTPGSIADVPTEPVARRSYLHRSVDAVPDVSLPRLFALAFSLAADEVQMAAADLLLLERTGTRADQTEWLLKHVEGSVGTDPIDGLGMAILLRATCDDVVIDLMARARETGATWGQIGDAVGISGDTARKRFGRRRNT